MKIKNALKYIGFLIIALPFLGVACTSSSVGPSPKYLLTSSNSETNGNYEYYEINGGTEYAVGLTETGKSSTAAINIDSKYNGKDVTGIWRYGFADSKATSITLPNTITVIDYEAFMGSKISSVTIPGSITQIGEAAFYSCKGLTKVTIQNTTGSSSASLACSCDKVTIEDDGEITPCTLTTIPGFCFFNCESLKELVLPQSIEEIGVEAFQGCRSLYTTLAFMNIRAIRSRAFQGCEKLMNVYISDSFFDVEQYGSFGTIEDKAFDGCNSELKFWLVCSTDNVDTWLTNHSDNKWRWKNETLNPETSSNLYTYEVTPSGAEYTSDWIFTTVNGDVEITSYIGPVEIESTAVKFLNIPDELPSGSGNKVRTIAVDAFDTVKAKLERIYLPTTLRRIEKGMFNGDYKNLIVVDNSVTCKSDEQTVDAGQNVEKRIDLHNITSLEVIANNAFKDMPKLNEITRLHLPYSLKAVGNKAFGSSENGKHLRKVVDFTWDYKESGDDASSLEVIGGEAFYELGVDDNSASYSSSNVARHRGYYKNGDEDTDNPLSNRNYKLTELVFPRTFRHFGITEYDNNTFALGGVESNDAKFGKSAFAACPLISKVVFRGSLESTVATTSSGVVDTDTEDLVIPTETFVMNESLRTVVFEERCGRSILFHTAGTATPAIGWSSGKNKNDFGGDPGIQTIVLPNKYTTLRMQKYAFAGNSRAALYYTDSRTKNTIVGSTIAKCCDAIGNIAGNSTPIGNVSEWKLIGNEKPYNNTYPGYWLADENKNDIKNTYDLNQTLSENSSIVYKDTIHAIDGEDGVINITLGAGNTSEYVVKDKCAFVCYNDSKAMMTNYLYDRYDRNFSGTARVPSTVKRTIDTKTCTVNTIGPSAFSACYCDTTSYANVSSHLDLTAVELPNTIATIREYAFMRAYGITKVSAYNQTTGELVGDYKMPSSLTSIGKHAFAFTNIPQILNIPNTCKFYENNNSDNNKFETSVFSNNFALRKVTFGNNSTSSNYYTTTTYTSGSNTYTSAIYSKSGVSKNKSALLLVLNRDTGADRTSSAASSPDCTISDGKADFNGQYNYPSTVVGYAYGAFKMCYWINSLTVGTSLTSSIDQPLISGLYDPSTNKSKIVYLNTPYDFTKNKNDVNLSSVSFGDSGSISTPPYSFEGCGNLVRIRLPQVEDAHIPAGLFASVENANIIFEVPKDAEASGWKECDPGVLDLTYTKYSQIDAEAFKGTKITKVIAPITDTFTVDESAFADSSITEFDFTHVTNNVILNNNAFANCEDLSKIDFTDVASKVTINGAFKGATISDSLFTYSEDALVEFGDEAFKGASINGGTFTFPVTTAIVGNSCFEDCTTLTTVAAAGKLVNLQKVTTNIDSEANKNNAGHTEGYIQIGNFAFFHCTNLTSFDFDAFEGIERIGHYAFSMLPQDANGKVSSASKNPVANNATICSGGTLNLPSTITNLGVGAFSGTKITSATINSTALKFERGKDYSSNTRVSDNKGCHTFRTCSELTFVAFTDHDCTWNTEYVLKNKDGQDNTFSNCGKLESIYLTSNYDIQYPSYTATTDGDSAHRPDSMVWESYSGLKFYTYLTTNQYDTSKPTPNKYWRRMEGNNTADIVYWAESNANIVKQSGTSYVEILAGSLYWCEYEEVRVYLGAATIDANTGKVTFASSGYYADSTGIHKS